MWIFVYETQEFTEDVKLFNLLSADYMNLF